MPHKLHPLPVPALELDLQPEPAGLEQLARAVPFRDLWLLWLDLPLSPQSNSSEQISIERTDIQGSAFVVSVYLYL